MKRKIKILLKYKPTSKEPFMNELIIPGMLVKHPFKKDWGVGQVQSKIGSTITVNFENAGKKTVNGTKIDLIAIKN